MSSFTRKFATSVVTVILGSFLCFPSIATASLKDSVTTEPSVVASQTRESTQPDVTLTKSGGKYYVNNHEITFNFHYDSEFYDRTAWYVSHFRVEPTPQTAIIGAQVVDFSTNYSMTKDNVLIVSATGLDGYVNHRCGGVYDDPNATYSFSSDFLMIDPDTGNVFDFLDQNYFYKYGFMNYRLSNAQTIPCQGC